MNESINVFGVKLEYHFLSGWIKYMRIRKEYSQESLAFSICSASHLSYFENGKKKLRSELIEALLIKLGITCIEESRSIGLIRKQFYEMMKYIEFMNKNEAKRIYLELLEYEMILNYSPYNIEYKIYQLLYNSYFGVTSIDELKQDIIDLDKIFNVLDDELKHIFLIASGRVFIEHIDHNDGIRRLEESYNIKQTPWLNYIIGRYYCFHNHHLLGINFLEKALSSYEQSGHYNQTIWCHNYLGICYSNLKQYDKSELHYKTALTGAQYFDLEVIFSSLFNNISTLYHEKGEFNEAVIWAQKSIESAIDPILPICNYIKSYLHIGSTEDILKLFQEYRVDKYISSKYYQYLDFLYYSTFHFNETIFYQTVKDKILPHFETINYISFCITIKLKLIEYLESNHRYKEANSIYKYLYELK